MLLVMTSIWLLGSICQLLASPMEERERESDWEREGREVGRAEETSHIFFIIGHRIVEN